ncbi:glycosyltransferase family 2 protein [Octadecabacter sp. G9-8]|uniref:Glycosyltransferase family 2 protein n=1 Tax=Octadecabacter dasysiphoniae TaxID=2909341 RepID=A0ABS9CZ45_9RHOB|nr:glycosyltransferase family 2 protein [Octadecabacter dasysiphoniae]MCF2872464.1 glycosyltransferase family 2 protein [Octadecabacter dasysiphoniae]
MWPFRPKTPPRASRIAIKPPVADAVQAPLALVLIVRNEAARLYDWLTFHALAGVSHVFIYDNASDDDTVAIAQAFTGCDVTVIPWVLNTSEARTGMILPRQILAYAHAISTFGGGFKRMGFIDTDEYLVPKDHATLPAALAALNHPANLSLPWAMFGHNGHDGPASDAVPFAYTARAAVSQGPLLNYKCIVDPCALTQVSTHKFEVAGSNKTTNTRGAIATNKTRSGAFVCDDVIQMNHYYLMSRSEMRAKMDNPAVSGTDPAKRGAAIAKKAALIEAAPVQDDAAVAFLARHGITTTAQLRAKFAGPA